MYEWPEGVETVFRMGLGGQETMRVQVVVPYENRLRLVAQICFVSYCVGPGRKVRLGGRRPWVP